ncbi:MAG: hypothetical protein P1V97_21875 [Planctomycetota bacterium]|nr:hypothetical protein [Planctomycetota bacterium]
MKTKPMLIGITLLVAVSGALYFLLIASHEQDKPAKVSASGKRVLRKKNSPGRIDPGENADARRDEKNKTPKAKAKMSDEDIVKAHDSEKARRDWEAKKKKESGANRLKNGWNKKKKARKGFSKKKLSAEDRKRWTKWAKAKNAYLEPKRLTIHARIVDASQVAIPGARVLLRGSAKLPDQAQNIETRTNDEGQFTLSGTRYQFHLTIEGPPGFIGQTLLIPWTDASEIDLGTIVLVGSTNLTGFVEGPDGTVVSGVTVKLFAVNDYPAYSRAENVAYTPRRANPIATVQTNNAGQFTLIAPAGESVIIAEKNGFRSSEVFRLTAKVDRSRNQTLRLRRGQDVMVIVKDQANNVLAGSELRLVRFGELYNPDWKQPVLASGTSNSEGRVLFSNLTFQRYQVAVLIDNDAPSCQNFQVNFENPAEITVVVQRSVQVKGQLKSNSQDSPLQGAGILVYREGADGLRDRRQINAKVAVGGDGRFDLGKFHTGRYVCFIQPGAGFFSATKHFEVASGAADLDLGMIELRALTTLKVQVRDAQSKGIKGCHFLVSTSNFDESRFADSSEARAITDSDGKASLINMPSGQVVVAVLDALQQVLCYKTIELSTQSDQAVVINVSGDVGELHGTVIVGAGETFRGGQLELKPEGTHVAGLSISVPATGIYRKEAIPIGTYSVAFVPTGQIERIRLDPVTIFKNRDSERDFTLPSPDH